MAERISPEAHAAYQRIHATDEFAELKRSYLRFVVPLTVEATVKCPSSPRRKVAVPAAESTIAVVGENSPMTRAATSIRSSR